MTSIKILTLKLTNEPSGAAGFHMEQQGDDPIDVTLLGDATTLKAQWEDIKKQMDKYFIDNEHVFKGESMEDQLKKIEISIKGERTNTMVGK